MKRTVKIKPYRIERKPAVNYDEIKGRDVFLPLAYEFGPTLLCELNNAYVTPFGIVLSTLKIVKESVGSWFKKTNHYLTFIKKILLRKVKRSPGLVVLGHNGFYDNYYHFTCESLPRFFLLKDFKDKGDVLVPAKAPRFFLDYLELLGFEKKLYLNTDELLFAKELVFTSHTADGLMHNPEVLKEMAAYLRRKVISKGNHFHKGPNIFVSRAKASYRKLTNEKDLITLLQPYNFQIIFLEDYTVTEQISLFSRARNLIAVHGAGNANIMYMDEGSLFIELINEKHFQACYFNLADVFNIDTIMIQGEGEHDLKKGPYTEDFSVNLERVRYYLDNYLK